MTEHERKMDLGVGKMGFIFCGKHPLTVARTQVSDTGSMGPLVNFTFYFLHSHQMLINDVLSSKVKVILPFFS